MAIEKWKPGKNGGEVVAEEMPPDAKRGAGHDEIDYYGGYLVAESIPMQRWVDLIVQAPTLREELQNCRRMALEFSAPRQYWNTADEEAMQRIEATIVAAGGTL